MNRVFDRRSFLTGTGAFGITALVTAKSMFGHRIPEKLTFVSLPDPLEKCNVIWDVSGFGYQVDEYLVSGTGSTFAPLNPTEAGKLDRPDTSIPWGSRDTAYAENVPPDFGPRRQTGTSAYTNRIIVYRPRDPRKFSGNVIFEAFHPGGMIEVFTVANRFFLNRGDAVVHIDVPGRFGVMKKLSEERYGPLSMPDRTVFWSSVSQLATLIRMGGPNSPIRVPARHLYFTGYSGSADVVYTFLSYHHRLTRMPNGKPVFSGYLPLCHIMPVPPIDAVIVTAATQSDFFGATDGDTPATRGFRKLYNSDSTGALRRRYELPGAFHAPLQPPEQGMAIPLRENDAGTRQFATCADAQKWPAEAMPNHFPNRAILEACFHHASRWAEAGKAPPHAPLIETDENDKVLLDDNGNARGGLRLPDISVPADTFVRAARGGLRSCASTGYRVPFSREKMKSLYGSREHYLALYNAAADKLVAGGYILPEGAAKMKTDRRWLAPVF